MVETVQQEERGLGITQEEITYVTVAQYTQNYTYDEAGQLTYARDTKTGETHRYTYDSSGNITTALTYKHTPSGTETLYSRKNYGYVNGVLKSVSESILGNTATVTTYQADNMGNPTKITKGSTSATLSWGRGRMLTGITWNSTNYVNYEYNADGLRAKKTFVRNGTTTVSEYIWGENGLAGMVTGNNTVIVLYDVEGEPAGFTVNGIAYTYIKNIQGDVMQILDSNGNAVVTYSYDPWGVPTVTGNTTLAALNPCSYRGYDYDEETGYYYLQSRYYDPAVGRFLNADDAAFLGASGTMMGNNLFMYCDNDPIDALDPSGYWYFELSVDRATVILDLILWGVACTLMYKFGTLKWLSKISKAVKEAWQTLIRALAKAIINSANWIAKQLFAGYYPTNAFLNFSFNLLAKLLESALTYSVGYALAKILDQYDGDGPSGKLVYYG